jgi:hypothetical protein
MAQYRQASATPVGEYNGSATWRSGSGIEERERAADDIGIKVTDKWLYLYLRDGEEIVKLSRSRNTSAQIYLGKSLREVMQERVRNWIRNSTSCCYSGGDGRCMVHTLAWVKQEIEERLSAIITDDQWPSVLAARQIAAKEAQEYAEHKAREREIAQLSGDGEWRKSNGDWKVWTLLQPDVGSTVTVRTRFGSANDVIIDSSRKINSGWLHDTHPAPVGVHFTSMAVMEGVHA